MSCRQLLERGGVQGGKERAGQALACVERGGMLRMDECVLLHGSPVCA